VLNLLLLLQQMLHNTDARPRLHCRSCLHAIDPPAAAAASAVSTTDATRHRLRPLRCRAAAVFMPLTLLLLLLLQQMLHDTDAGLGCAAALALQTLAQGHAANQTRIGLQPGAITGLVSMALGQQQQGPALQAMAAAALKRLADNHPVNRARIRRESSSFCEYYWPAGVGMGVGAEGEQHGKQQQQQQQLVRWQGMLAERGQQQHVCVV
jgi:hypothetical protein